MREILLSPSNGIANPPASESIAEGDFAVSTLIDVQGHATGSSTNCQDAQIRDLSAEEGISARNHYPQKADSEEHGSISLQEADENMHKPPNFAPRTSNIGHAAPFNADEANDGSPPNPPREKEKAVRWRDLPKKGQLAILTLARLSEPLTQTSLQSYMFYQLRSFDPSLQDSAISSQVGILQGCFTFAQFVTAVIWGRISDAEWGGRKRVMVIGLLGTGISCVGFGFSRSFAWAVFFRMLGGTLNGNVGVLRTMISEIVKEKKFQTRAFLLLPMCFNIGTCLLNSLDDLLAKFFLGVIIGPVLGGVLADPVGSYPRVFGENSLIGGRDGVWWLKHWPYALPNLMSAIFLFLSASAVIFGLEETLESIEGRPDWGLTLGHSIATLFRRLFSRHPAYAYTALNYSDYETPPNSATHPRFDSYELESGPISKPKPRQKPKKAPFRSIFTSNVLITLLCHGLLAFHIGTFNSLWFIFLSTPRSPASYENHLPFHFTGGLALQPRTIGMALAILGFIGLFLQLGLYPLVTARWGTITTWRVALLCPPIAYTLVPYLAVVPSTHPSPHQADGPWVWLSLLGVLAVQVLGRTFVLPGAIILVNNCSPSSSVLGTVHGIAQSVSSAARTVGPMLGAWGFGKGLDAGVVGAVWWALAGMAMLGFGVSGFVREGNGLEKEADENGEESEKEGLVRGEEMEERHDDEGVDAQRR